MEIKRLPDNPYLLLTPASLSTTKSVKAAMLRDWCTWDDDYKMIVQEGRDRLVRMAACRGRARSLSLDLYDQWNAMESDKGKWRYMKAKGFVIYPGMVSKAGAFRIGSIGDAYPTDMERLVNTIGGSIFWQG